MGRTHHGTLRLSRGGADEMPRGVPAYPSRGGAVESVIFAIIVAKTLFLLTPLQIVSLGQNFWQVWILISLLKDIHARNMRRKQPKSSRHLVCLPPTPSLG